MAPNTDSKPPSKKVNRRIGDILVSNPKTKKMPAKGRKRTRESENGDSTSNKRQKVNHPSHLSIPGVVLACGEGDVGQLGLGEDIMERMRPALIDLPDKIVQVCAGGMHTGCLTEKGEVYTFGCNDEGTLGRSTEEEGTETVPGKVDGLPCIVQISAGDSHTAALSEDGQVFIWGNFRDANGSMGLTKDGIQNKPVTILECEIIVKIISGGDHLVCLSSKGEVFTLGCAEQGQLGRVAECFTHRGGRKGLDYILSPGAVRFRRKKCVIADVWAGQFVTFAKDTTGNMYSWGLNNYYQLGFPDMLNRYVPEEVKTFAKKTWTAIDGGQHHSVAMDSDGQAYSLGRAEYGRLGLGQSSEEKREPTHVKLEGKCKGISAGQSVSFALMEDGSVFGWGMGTSKQLANGGEDDCWEPTKLAGKQLNTRKVVQLSAGGQHTVLLATDE